MNELDLNLLDAWHRAFERCQGDSKEARKRYERTLPGTCLDRPARAWCMALRASDTRLIQGIGSRESAVGGESQELKRWMRGLPLQSFGLERGAGVCAGEVDGCGDEGLDDWKGGGSWLAPGALEEMVRAQVAHEIVVDGDLLRRVGGPVWIDEPGVPLTEAATMLGKDYGSLRRWLPVKIGRTVAEKEAATRDVGFGERRWAVFRADETGRGVLNVRYVPAGAAGRKKGMEVPVVWSDGPLDPSGPMGRPPVSWWGSSWQSLAEKIPENFVQVLERVPRFLPCQGDLRFRGWWWRCPGLGNPRGVGIGSAGSPQDAKAAGLGEFRGCGRLVSMLYAPLPVWTIGRYVDVQEGLAVEGLSGRWLPGVMDRWAGRRRLACRHCWRVRNGGAAERHGWNEFVTHLSGGLLYGHEVKKPAGFAYERRRAYVKRGRKALKPQIHTDAHRYKTGIDLC